MCPSEPFVPRDDGQSPDGWRALFAGGSPRAILARLCEGDPLEIGPRCDEALAEAAYLLAHRKVIGRALARIAHAAPKYNGRRPLGEFLQKRIEASIEELVDEEQQELWLAGPVDLAEYDPYPLVARRLGVELREARVACSVVNRQPVESRKAFIALVIEGRSLAACARAGVGSPDDLLARVEQGLRAISNTLGRKVDWPLGGASDERKEGGADHDPVDH
ncbi:MAG: hypothetical protein HZA53_15640 [Planctomycetes bacterium]|nr:hypothetical protein [Planctomycetota bacterium]